MTIKCIKRDAPTGSCILHQISVPRGDLEDKKLHYEMEVPVSGLVYVEIVRDAALHRHDDIWKLSFGFSSADSFDDIPLKKQETRK